MPKAIPHSRSIVTDLLPTGGAAAFFWVLRDFFLPHLFNQGSARTELHFRLGEVRTTTQVAHFSGMDEVMSLTPSTAKGKFKKFILAPIKFNLLYR